MTTRAARNTQLTNRSALAALLAATFAGLACSPPPPTGVGGAAGSGGAGGGAGQCGSAPALPLLALSTAVPSAGLSALSHAVQAPGSNDWYLVEQGGRVMIWSGGALRSTPFIDLRSESAIGGGYEERGLHSLAFAPDYASSGKVYVNLTATAGAALNSDLVLEFRRSAQDPYSVDPFSRRVLLETPGGVGLLGNVHNSYELKFGPDNLLYVGMGDGGGTCNSERPGVPQDVASPFGKLLRLDPNAPAPHAAAGNPFASGGDARVLHYGLRNPFRFNFDRATGDLYIGDVGQWGFEELDVAPRNSAGLNFGWGAFEGTTATCTGRTLRPGSVHTPPAFVADRRAGSCGQFCDWTSVVAGVVYRGTAIPALAGTYLFGDYTGARMVALTRCGTQTSPVSVIRKQCAGAGAGEACFSSVGGAAGLGAMTAIVEGNDGELYLVANRNTLLKVVPRP
ncbi:MAG TPA: PQQ-dependent sugar dehydrogenase [Polyangiaceae bacterium]|nr:PQQ-dependent sugar dehydrogenase [Polyangiaceae bacterium]